MSQFISKIQSRKQAGLLLAVLAVTLLAAGLRIYAANLLRIDWDEPVYLEAALQYNNDLRAGRWTMLTWNEINAEHPAFYKVVYGAALYAKPPIQKIYFEKDLPVMTRMESAPARPWAMVGRYVSNLFGVLAVLLLALLNPLAGLLLAVHTLAIKFTSSFYLEALPAFTSLASAACYLRWYQQASAQGKRQNLAWLGLSAGFLGMSVASKYNYFIIGAAVGVHYLAALVTKKVRPDTLVKMFAWGVLSLAAFFVCDPYLWKHTARRLWESLTFHSQYSQSIWVTRYDYPFWQPFAWFSRSFPHFFPAFREAFFLRLDPLIAVLAVIGLPRLAVRRPLYFTWLVLGFALLLLWPTKWPQYTMIVIAPYCLSAGEGLAWGIERLWQRARPHLAKRQGEKNAALAG